MNNGELSLAMTAAAAALQNAEARARRAEADGDGIEHFDQQERADRARMMLRTLARERGGRMAEGEWENADA